MPKLIDRTGEKFGRLTVLGLSGLRGKDRLVWVECECGTKKEVVQSKLTVKVKPVRSCGCLAKDNHHRTHSMTSHNLYPIWRAMIGRCYNESNGAYLNYGGRGITVCHTWKESPEEFIYWLKDSGYKKGLEIDRIDNSKGYSPDNCRVTTISKNCRNRRNNIHVYFEDEKRLLIDLAEEYSINYSTLYARVKTRGMKIEDAIKFKHNRRKP